MLYTHTHIHTHTILTSLDSAVLTCIKGGRQPVAQEAGKCANVVYVHEADACTTPQTSLPHLQAALHKPPSTQTDKPFLFHMPPRTVCS